MPDLRNQLRRPNTGPYPIPQTAFTDAIASGWKKLTHPAANVAPGVGGLLGGPGKSVAGLQDMASGLMQMLTSPAASAAAEFSPLLQQVRQIPVGPRIGNESANLGQVTDSVTKLPGEATKALLNRGFGYDKERAQEVGDTAGLPYGKLAALAKVGAGAGGVAIANTLAFSQLDPKILQRSDIQHKYNTLLNMSEAGKEAKDIFRVSKGAYIDPLDGDARFEIPMHDFRLKYSIKDLTELADEAKKGNRLHPRFDEIFSFPEMYETAPWFGDQRVKFQKKYGGHYDPDQMHDPFTFPMDAAQNFIDSGIRPNPGTMQLPLHEPWSRRPITPKRLLSVAGHEGEHGGQFKNPQASLGTSVEAAGSFENYLRHKGEADARVWGSSRLDFSDQDHHYFFPWNRVIPQTDFVTQAGHEYNRPYYDTAPDDMILRYQPADDQARARKWQEFYQEYDRLTGRIK